jgi:hypothetical protein
MLQRTHKTNSDRYWTKTFPSTDIVMPKFVLDMLDCDILLHFSSFCLKLDNFSQISSFFIPQNKIDALVGFSSNPAIASEAMSFVWLYRTCHAKLFFARLLVSI